MLDYTTVDHKSHRAPNPNDIRASEGTGTPRFSGGQAASASGSLSTGASRWLLSESRADGAETEGVVLAEPPWNPRHVVRRI
jgi:hypothetical protein